MKGKILSPLGLVREARCSMAVRWQVVQALLGRWERVGKGASPGVFSPDIGEALDDKRAKGEFE